MSVVARDIDGMKSDAEGELELRRERLKLFRDALISMLNDCPAMTQAKLGVVFNLHPEHIGRITRKTPKQTVELVHEIVSGRVPRPGIRSR